MTKREKVIKGLEEAVDWLSTETSMTVVDQWVVRDALALLKAQEPRVMTLEELVAWQKLPIVERDPIYVEYRKCKGFGAPHWAQDNFGYNVATCQDNYKSGVYGLLIRCWTSRPTKEQMEATPWMKN